MIWRRLLCAKCSRNLITLFLRPHVVKIWCSKESFFNHVAWFQVKYLEQRIHDLAKERDFYKAKCENMTHAAAMVATRTSTASLMNGGPADLHMPPGHGGQLDLSLSGAAAAAAAAAAAHHHDEYKRDVSNGYQNNNDLKIGLRWSILCNCFGLIVLVQCWIFWEVMKPFGNFCHFFAAQTILDSDPPWTPSITWWSTRANPTTTPLIITCLWISKWRPLTSPLKSKKCKTKTCNNELRADIKMVANHSAKYLALWGCVILPVMLRLTLRKNWWFFGLFEPKLLTEKKNYFAQKWRRNHDDLLSKTKKNLVRNSQK